MLILNLHGKEIDECCYVTKKNLISTSMFYIGINYFLLFINFTLFFSDMNFINTH